MDGPWYENQGPNAEQVREDVLKRINIVKVGKDVYEKEKDKIISNALIKVIPNNRNDFGSWRGYSTFGLGQQLTKEVISEVKRGYALLILEKKFKPYCMHKLYNPENGLMMKKTKKSTLVGKKCNDGYWYQE